MTSRKFRLLRNGLLVATAALALAVWADIPSYKSFTATGTSSAEVIIPASPGYATRAVSAVVQSDKAGSLLKWSAGVNAYSIILTNVAGTLITVNQTNNLNANDILIVSKADGSTNASATISSISNTNVTLSGSVFATTTNDSVYKMSAVTSWAVGAATNVQWQGEAIYTASSGRPIRVLLDGTSACTINSIVVRQE